MKKQYHAEFANEACVSDWLGLVNMVADDFPGLVIADYTETLLKNIARQTALCVKDNGNIVGILLFSPNQHCLSCMAVRPIPPSGRCIRIDFGNAPAYAGC